MNPDDTEYLKSLPKDEAEAILHARNVAVQMKMHQKAGIISPLAVLVYGSDKVFDRSTQLLGDAYLNAYLGQPRETRTAADAITHCLRLDLTNVQIAAILMAKLGPTRLAEAAAQRDISTKEVEVALVFGIAALLDAKQLLNVLVVSWALTAGTVALRQLDRIKSD